MSLQSNDRFIVKLENQIESFAGNKNYPARILRDKIHKTGLKTLVKKLKTVHNVEQKNKIKIKA